MALHVQSEASEKDAVKKEINEEILAFEAWFRQEIEDTPLMKVEESILRTYLQWKLLAEKK